MLVLLFQLILMMNFIKAKCPYEKSTTNFNNLSQLSFNECEKPINFNNWKIQPNTKLILDNTLKLDGLTLILNDTLRTIELSNFKGFDIMSDPFRKIKFINSALEFIYWVIIGKTDFNFYLNNKLINEKECLQSSNKNWKNLISNSKLLFLGLASKYSLKTCPYIFKNSIINALSLNYIRSSYLNENLLEFIKIKNSDDINSDIFHVDFKVYRIQFNDNLLNKDIFKKTKSIDISGILNGIQDDLFKSIDDLKILRIRTENVKNLFAKNNKWLQYLNFYLKPVDPDTKNEEILAKSLMLIIYQSFNRVTYYDYPNEDICLFSKFPHNKIVWPQLRPNNKYKCHCTEIFLTQYSIKYADLIHYYSNQVTTNYMLYQYYMDVLTDIKFTKCCKNYLHFTQLVSMCDFTSRLSKCNIQSISRVNKTSYFYMEDWQEIKKISSLIFAVYLNSIITLILIILNSLTIAILKTKLNQKNRIYSFYVFSTALSIIYSIIVSFRLIGICVDFDFYCSPLSESKFNVYFKTIFILFIGETIKSASNFNYISFSLSRYIKITSSKNVYLLKFNELKKLKFIFILLIISVFINLYHFFEYNFNLSKFPEYIAGLEELESFFKYSNPSDEFINNFSNFQYYLLNCFFYIKLIFSDLFYIIFNSIIDLKLFVNIKKQEKKSRTITAITRATTSPQTTITNNNKKVKTKRLAKMIILNGLNCFILRFPFAFVNYYGFIFRYDKENKTHLPNIPAYIVCRAFKICSNFYEISYFFYLLSLLFQFLIFFKFDKNFNIGYNDIKAKIRRKLFNN